MRFIDHQKAELRLKIRHPLFTKCGVIESFGSNEENVQLVCIKAGAYCLPFGHVSGVHHSGTNPGAFGCLHLVAHERKQRGDNEGNPGTLGTHQKRRNKIHGRFSPACTLYHEGAAAVGDKRLDSLELPGVKARIRVCGELSEQGLGVFMECWHGVPL